jgi:predicted small metal-binding protein
MKKLLSCREVWCYDDCDYIIAGETEEDVVTNTAEHGIKKHGKSKRDMVKLGENLRGFIYTIS